MPMRIDVVTLFPEMFAGYFGASMMKRAIDKNIIDVRFTNFRDFADGKHRQVDDSPFGGGSGMVLKPEPLFRAVRHILASSDDAAAKKIVVTDPCGEVFTQEKAKEFSRLEQLIIVCGHYEGYDARFVETIGCETVSVGDYVLTGGELPAMIVIDATARMLPNVLGSAESANTDSFYDGLLGFPQYTRPREFEGMAVPDVLISGDHEKIRRWRREQSLLLTKKNRPELLAKANLSDEEKNFLRKYD